MTERRRRGTRSSSRCFQSCSALGFLFFMVWVQSGNIEKGSRQLKVKREDKDLTQRAQSPGETGHREKRKSRSLAALGMTTFALSARARARYRRAKKKRRRQSRRGRAEARPYKGKSERERTARKKERASCMKHNLPFPFCGRSAPVRSFPCRGALQRVPSSIVAAASSWPCGTVPALLRSAQKLSSRAQRGICFFFFLCVLSTPDSVLSVSNLCLL